jgi:hypothetical protein
MSRLDSAKLTPYQGPDLAGTGLTYRPGAVEHHGSEETFVWPGRQVVDVPGRTWPAARPEECTDETNAGEWLGDGAVLVCPGCGLDST